MIIRSTDGGAADEIPPRPATKRTKWCSKRSASRTSSSSRRDNGTAVAAAANPAARSTTTPGRTARTPCTGTCTRSRWSSYRSSCSSCSLRSRAGCARRATSRSTPCPRRPPAGLDRRSSVTPAARGPTMTIIANRSDRRVPSDTSEYLH